MVIRAVDGAQLVALMEQVSFSAHNIRLDDGTFTRPDSGFEMAHHPRFLSAKRVLSLLFPGGKSSFSILDLGCLEGGYTVEFARLGFRSLGLEVRASNFAACQYVKERVGLPNLSFVQDDAWNAPRYGSFDVVFCCGLLYHMDRPRTFLETISPIARRALIVQTHFATDRPSEKFHLSGIASHDGADGRWYTEYTEAPDTAAKETAKWSSWHNTRSFWMTRPWILQSLLDRGFDVVFEQFDGLAPSIVESMMSGYHHTDDRGTFVGIRTIAS